MDDLNDDAGFEELEGLDAPEVSEGAESIEDSIAAAFEEVDVKAAEAKEPEGDKPLEAKEDDKESALTKAARELASAKKGKKGQKQVIEGAALDLSKKGSKLEAEEKIQPSQDWDVKLKEEFNALPKAVQQRSLDFYNGIKGNATKALQELNREKTKHAEVNEIVDFYLPRWGMQGQSAGQVARELFAAQEVLLKDPAYGIATLIQKLKVDYDAINAHLEGKAPAQKQQVVEQQFQQPNSPLTEDQLFAKFQAWKQQESQQSEIQTARAQVAKLTNLTGLNGQYVYPELHIPEDIERLKPLVDDIRESQPDISWEDATKEAVLDLRALKARRSGTPSPNVSRLPTQEQIQRARQASAASVRGRGNATAATNKLPESESIEESLRAVWGGNNGSY